MVPRFCPPGDDNQYGSSVEHDIFALQAISRRVHYGALYIAEAKYARHPDMYREHIQDNNPDGLMALLTRKDVEERILARVREKVDRLQACVNTEIRTIIPADTVIALYRDFIIPLTKQGEIRYLLQRRPE